MQYECINCGLCVDACNSVMDKVGYERGLIRYTSEDQLKNGQTHFFRWRLVAYAAILVVMCAAFVYSVGNREPVVLDVDRDRGARMFRIREGAVENVYTLNVQNMDRETHTFDLTVNEAQMLGPQDPTIFLFSYHLSDADARLDQNPISNPESYTNTENPQDIFVRFYNNTENGYVVSSFQIETDDVLTTNDFENELNFQLYPNPSVSEVFITSHSLEPLHITIYSLNGSVVSQLMGVVTSKGTRIDISNLTTGMYFVNVSSNTTSVTKKLIVK